MDQLAALKTFARVAEFGSFSAAADALGLSRAAVSTQVAALEKRFGAKLLHRTTRKVALTSDGSRLLERCRPVFRELQAAEDELGPSRKLPAGRLRVHLVASLGRQLLVPALPGFLARYPSLELDLQLSDRIVDPPDEGVQVAIRGGTITNPTLVARRAAASRWITCAAPGYLDGHGWPHTPAELLSHQLIGHRAPGTRLPHSWIFREGRRQLSLDPPCRAILDDPEALLAAAVQGAGIIQTTDLLAAPALAARQLIVLLPGTAVRGPPISVIYPQVGQDVSAVRAFAGFAVEVLGGWQRRVAGVTGLMDTP